MKEKCMSFSRKKFVGCEKSCYNCMHTLGMKITGIGEPLCPGDWCSEYSPPEPKEDFPRVARGFVTSMLLDLENSLKVQIDEEHGKDLPNHLLIAMLWESIQLCREHDEVIKSRIQVDISKEDLREQTAKMIFCRYSKKFREIVGGKPCPLGSLPVHIREDYLEQAEDLREQIAEKMYFLYRWNREGTWQNITESYRNSYREKADVILALFDKKGE